MDKWEYDLINGHVVRLKFNYFYALVNNNTGIRSKK